MSRKSPKLSVEETAALVESKEPAADAVAGTAGGWESWNQEQLGAALARVRSALSDHAASLGNGHPLPPREVTRETSDTFAGATEKHPQLSAIGLLCRAFSLTPFERDVILLCAGVDLDASIAQLCARAHGDAQKLHPTFSLALSALPGPHWSALSPSAPLRYFRLIDVLPGAPASPFTLNPLRVDERILHFLVGIRQMDERLSGVVHVYRGASPSSIAELVPSHQDIARQLTQIWSGRPQTALQSAPGFAPSDQAPVAQLIGEDARSKKDVALASARLAGRSSLITLRAEALPQQPGELGGLLRLWEREAALEDGVLYLDGDEISEEDHARRAAFVQVVETAGQGTPLIVCGRQRLNLTGRTLVTWEMGRPTLGEQRQLWRDAVHTIAPPELAGNAKLGDGADQQITDAILHLTTHFDVSAHTIRAATQAARGAKAEAEGGDIWQKRLWDACRVQARPRLDALSKRIESHRGWDDLVLPPVQKEILQSVAAHVRQRTRVYEQWGFGGQSGRGLGISAMFAGVSGTGKTTAAEVLARELELDMYRIDLSQVVSKYIGETEKNLSQIFDAAEEGGVVLLFDEADALFGKRSEVKDSHDRYANVEVSYLLQRMETYRGLAVLTTNLKGSIDTAFLRRIRFVVQFPFPGPTERAEIWRRVFPALTPTDGIDPLKLAQLTVSGGNIKNMALNAAFLAADEGEPVQMRHVLRAAQTEYAKLEKTLTDSETQGWL